MYNVPNHYAYSPYQGYHYPQHHGYYQQRPYPEVDVSIFEGSVTAFQKIADESITILEKFTDREFTHKLMTAAQAGNQREVDRLMKSIGTSTPITTQYTPSGILLTIHADAQGTQCCTLTMYLKWGN
ncbi:hypothetical protein KO561_18910 [Radiobacillus kanasensis]|uniref:hypothetical protein n=1 Tax=Radiobacillus kanasensis TaxID=2844358 RepID=UPI001E5984FB|nr:hypothetical protein [Radiobacillus kanasensis]UFT99220.1 hypothetical protein KO561_18910 [Radiobacillus kanasensis]